MMAQTNSLAGKIEVGDTVETLDAKRTITGKVISISKKRTVRGHLHATVVGAEYPGGPEVRWRTHIDNLALIEKGGQGGATRRGHRRD